MTPALSQGVPYFYLDSRNPGAPSIKIRNLTQRQQTLRRIGFYPETHRDCFLNKLVPLLLSNKMTLTNHEKKKIFPLLFDSNLSIPIYTNDETIYIRFPCLNDLKIGFEKNSEERTLHVHLFSLKLDPYIEGKISGNEIVKSPFFLQRIQYIMERLLLNNLQFERCALIISDINCTHIKTKLWKTKLTTEGTVFLLARQDLPETQETSSLSLNVLDSI